NTSTRWSKAPTASCTKRSWRRSRTSKTSARRSSSDRASRRNSGCANARLRTRCPADPADAGHLERGSPQIEADHRAEQVQLDAFDPADRQAQIAAEASKHAGAGRGDADPMAAVRIILADRRRRQHRLELRHGV